MKRLNCIDKGEYKELYCWDKLIVDKLIFDMPSFFSNLTLDSNATFEQYMSFELKQGTIIYGKNIADDFDNFIVKRDIIIYINSHENGRYYSFIEKQFDIEIYDKTPFEVLYSFLVQIIIDYSLLDDIIGKYKYYLQEYLEEIDDEQLRF